MKDSLHDRKCLQYVSHWITKTAETADDQLAIRIKSQLSVYSRLKFLKKKKKLEEIDQKVYVNSHRRANLQDCSLVTIWLGVQSIT